MTEGRRRILSALLVYGALAAFAIGILVLDNRISARHPAPWLELSRGAAMVVSLALSAALLAFGIASTRVLVYRTRWAKRLHISFRQLLGTLSSREILVFAASSGIAEELFFRGAVQPWAGFIFTSVIFGLVHLGPTRAFLPWTIWAIAMGLLFGALYEATGELIGPIIAHVVINYENLHFINSHDPLGEEQKGSATVSIVGTRERGGGSRSWH